MNPFTENPGGKWLPSRHNLAAFRLIAAIVLARQAGRLRPKPDRRTAYILDRHQSAFENYTMSVLMTASIVLYLLALLQRAFGLSTLAIALLAAPTLAATTVLYQGFLHPIGAMLLLLVRSGALRAAYVVHLQTWATYLGFTAAALFVLRAATWVRFVGIFWLLLLAINAVAAVVMFALAPTVKSLEERMGGAPFDISYWDSAA